MTILTKIINIRFFIYIILLAAISFICIFGPIVLNPLYCDWLLTGGDLSQHYLGWKGFLNGQWTFPFGMTDQIKYPHYTSIIFTDSIPLFAILFKLFKFCLPNNFQYFGWWGLLSFILIGIFGFKITNRFIKNKYICLIFSSFYFLSTCFIYRVFFHTALAAQWLILLSIDFFVSIIRKEHSTKKTILYSILIGALCSSIHFYFVPMCFIVLFFGSLYRIMSEKKVAAFLQIVIPFLVASLSIFAILGGFSCSNPFTDINYGYFSSNLNCFINPLDWSLLFKQLAIKAGQKEGNAYLGFGFIILFILVIIFSIIDKRIRLILKEKYKLIICVSLILLFSYLYAISNIIVFNTTTILSINLPSFILNMFNVFRAGGRFIWIDVYFFFLICSYLLSKMNPFQKNEFSNFNFKVSLIFVCSFLQIIDLSKGFSDRFNNFSNKYVFQTKLEESNFWKQIKNNANYKSIILTENFNTIKKEDQKLAYSLADYAFNNKLTLNSFYFAREDITFEEDLYNDLQNINQSKIFISSKNSFFSAHKCFQFNYFIDNCYVSLPFSIPNYTPLNNFIYKYDFNGKYINNGYDKDNIRTLLPNGESYGNYLTMKDGTYHISIFGQKINECSFIFTSNNRKQTHSLQNLIIAENKVEFDLNLDKLSFNCELIIRNKSNKEIEINNITIKD